jgi:ferritin
MTNSRFADQLNAQIGEELLAHAQYIAVAAHYDALTMPRMAGFFFRQAREERDHAMMMLRYLLDTDAEIEIPAVAAPQSHFDGIVAPVELALAQERKVTEQIHALTRIARDENDFAAEQFMQWFIKEQVEEVATMQDLLAVVGRSEDDINDVETYVERELGAGEADATAPPLADA